MKYRREIDGLRAVAVMPVILFHAGFDVFSGGYIGVDVFFVISGYLITSILVSDLEAGKFSIGRFYERRARRILPALFFVILACLPFAYLWMPPPQLKDFAQSLVAVVFFASNILFWLESGYFGAAAELKPMLHTWSLAVEEQYYLIFPIFLLLAWRFGRQRVFWSIVVISVASLILAEWGWRNKPDANFYLAPTRAWELLAGSLCAFLTVGRFSRSSNVLSTFGLIAILFAIFAFDEETPFPSLYALVPVVGTTLIILFGTQGTWVAKLLSMRVFVGIGLISYSAYLWHQPLFAFARLRSPTEPSHLAMGIIAVAALLLAWGTWRWVEQPFRRRQSPLLSSRSQVFLASGLFGTLIVVLGISGHKNNGNFNRYDPQIIQALQDAGSESAVFDTAYRFDNDECLFSSVHLGEKETNRLTDCASQHGAGILVIGDSHATNLFHAIVRSGRETLPPFLVGITSNGCHLPALSDACPYDDVREFVANNSNAFSHIIYEKAGYLMLSSEKERDIRAEVRSGGAARVNEELVVSVAAWLESLSEFTPVIWYGPRLSPLISNNEIYELGCNGDFTMKASHIEAYTRLDDYLSDLVREDENLNYISQMRATNFIYPSDFGDCDGLFWFDENHFSPKGEVRFGGRNDLLRLLVDLD